MANNAPAMLNDSGAWKRCAMHAAHEERIKMLEEQRREDENRFSDMRKCLTAKMEKRIFYSILALLVGALLSFGGLSLHNTDEVSKKVDVLVEKINNLTVEVKIIQERMTLQDERMKKLEGGVSFPSGKDGNWRTGRR